MTLRDDLYTIREYFQYVAESDAEPVVCSLDESVMLYYVRGNAVLLKCTFCGHSVYPGTRMLAMMEDEVNAWKKSRGTMSG